MNERDWTTVARGGEAVQGGRVRGVRGGSGNLRLEGAAADAENVSIFGLIGLNRAVECDVTE